MMMNEEQLLKAKALLVKPKQFYNESNLNECVRFCSVPDILSGRWTHTFSHRVREALQAP